MKRALSPFQEELIRRTVLRDRLLDSAPAEAETEKGMSTDPVDRPLVRKYGTSVQHDAWKSEDAEGGESTFERRGVKKIAVDRKSTRLNSSHWE